MSKTTFRATMKWVNLVVVMLIIILAVRYLWSRTMSGQLGGMHDIALTGFVFFCLFFVFLTVQSIRRGRSKRG
jgi:dolichyl-phosphate-mannose--protein O-mannosyl transferase